MYVVPSVHFRHTHAYGSLIGATPDQLYKYRYTSLSPKDMIPALFTLIRRFWKARQTHAQHKAQVREP